MNLIIGTTPEGKPFTLPADLGDKKIALLAQSKKGKTYGLGDILEELAKAQRPFIATDPASNLWGLRVKPDGTPSGLKVVVIGGPNADIPFDQDAGERLAEALLSTPICAVIDLAFESLGSTRRFMTAFAGRLMRSKPEIPRVIVLEECPVLIPQNAFGVQAQICKAAVSKLATIGGNFGYGVIPACQRPATMDKDVLSQCEGLIVMGITHKKDRMTVKEWMEAKDIGDRVAAAFAELGSLQPGEAYYWNPGEDLFQRFTFRKRETLHPREMQKLGLKASALQLGDMEAFVEKVKRELTKTSAVVCTPPKNQKTAKALVRTAEHAAKADLSTNQEKVNLVPFKSIPFEQFERAQRDVELKDATISRLSEELRVERRRREDAHVRLENVRVALKPQYDALQKLFSEIGEASSPAANGEIGEAWTPWLSKAGSVGCKGMLEILIKRGRIKQVQLSTLAGVKYGGSTWRAYRSWMTRNHLAKIEGDEIEAAQL